MTKLQRPWQRDFLVLVPAIGGILLCLAAGADAMRRQAIWNDAISTMGERFRANHMSISSGTIQYVVKSGVVLSAPAPFFGAPPPNTRVPVEYRKSNPSHAWLVSSPPRRRYVPAFMFLIGGSMLGLGGLAAVRHNFQRRHQLGAGSIGFVALIVILGFWVTGPGPLPAARRIHVEAKQSGKTDSLSRAISNPRRPNQVKYVDTQLPSEEVVTLEAFDQAWKKEVAISDDPPGIVIEQLCKDSNMEFNRAGRTIYQFKDIQNALRTPVKFDHKFYSRLAAIQAISERLELQPVYSTTELAFNPKLGTSKIPPSTMAGPFLVQVTGATRLRDSKQSRVNLKVTAIDLPATAFSTLKNSAHPKYSSQHDPFELSLISNDANESGESIGLLSGSRSKVHASTTAFVALETHLIDDLPETTTKIDVAGRIKFALPAKIASVQFEQPKAKDVVTKDGIRLSIEEWRTFSDSASATFTGSGFPQQRVSIIGVDDRGKTFTPKWKSTKTRGENVTIKCYFTFAAQSLELRIATEVTPVEYEFSLKGIEIAPRH